MLITLLPLLIVGLLARIFGHTNYLSLCGLLAGSMTDPPALAFGQRPCTPPAARPPCPMSRCTRW